MRCAAIQNSKILQKSTVKEVFCSALTVARQVLTEKMSLDVKIFLSEHFEFSKIIKPLLLENWLKDVKEF